MQLFRARRRTVTLNLTPLIDVVLVLIIFFLMTTTFVLSSGIKVELPPGGAAQQAQDSDAIVLIAPDGSLFYQESRVDLQALRAALGRAHQQRPGLRVVIKADKSVPHGQVVEVMDVAKMVGIERLAIGTTPKKVPE
jgi:biopolymer transport protein ExbD